MATDWRYVYLVGYTYTLRNGAQAGAGSQNSEVTRSSPVTSLADVQSMNSLAADGVAADYPGYDAAFPGWRDTIVILGCSLLRVEEQRDGEWVLREHQPWGRVDT